MSQQINLFNPLFRRQKKYFSAKTMLQALSLILLGSLLLYGFARYRTSTIGDQAMQTEKSYQATQARLLEAGAQLGPRRPSQLLTDEVARMEGQLLARQHIVGLLAKGELANNRGYAGFFRALSRQAVPGLWITSFRVAGSENDLTINGRALKPELVPLFINRLKTEPLLAGKSFGMMELRLPEPEGADKNQAGYRFVEFTLGKSESEPAR